MHFPCCRWTRQCTREAAQTANPELEMDRGAVETSSDLSLLSERGCFGSQVDNVAHWGDILQMAVLELIRKVCRANPAELDQT